MGIRTLFTVHMNSHNGGGVTSIRQMWKIISVNAQINAKYPHSDLTFTAMDFFSSSYRISVFGYIKWPQTCLCVRQ